MLIYSQGSCRSTNTNGLAVEGKPRAHSINYVSSDYEVSFFFISLVYA